MPIAGATQAKTAGRTLESYTSIQKELAKRIYHELAEGSRKDRLEEIEGYDEFETVLKRVGEWDGKAIARDIWEAGRSQYSPVEQQTLRAVATEAREDKRAEFRALRAKLPVGSGGLGSDNERLGRLTEAYNSDRDRAFPAMISETKSKRYSSIKSGMPARHFSISSLLARRCPEEYFKPRRRPDEDSMYTIYDNDYSLSQAYWTIADF